MEMTLIDGYEVFFHSFIIVIVITESNDIFKDDDEKRQKAKTDVSALPKHFDHFSWDPMIVDGQPSG